MLLMAAFTIVSVTVFAQDTKKYSCPMHADITSDKPARCSKCGMNLTENKKEAAYSCPMHADITSDKPGKCSKCGMALKEKKG